MKLLFDDDIKDLPIITSYILFKGADKPDPQGLFSELIFGTTRQEQRTKFASIELHCNIFHPLIYMLLKKSFRKAIELVEKYKPFVYVNDVIREAEKEDKDILYGVPGLISIFDRLIKEKEGGVYTKFLKDVLNKYGQYKITNFIVIPPAYRPYTNGRNQSPLNDVYVKLIRQSHVISNIVPDERDENYCSRVTLIQKSANDIFDFVSTKVPSLLRENIEAKRVDFSARVVISGDPKIPVGYVGIPFKVIVKIAEPFVIYAAKQLGYKKATQKLIEQIEMISKGITEVEDKDFIRKAAEEAIKDKVVLFKRDPVLHAQSWQSDKVKIVDDDTMHLNPLYTDMAGADFDGDSVRCNVNLKIRDKTTNKIYKLENIDIMRLQDMTTEQMYLESQLLESQ